MPRIIVTADSTRDGDESAVMLTERVSVRDFESPHFQTQLVERLGWAVGDAHDAERARAPHTRADAVYLPHQREVSVVTTAS